MQKLRPVAPQPGGQDRPPRCRAAWGAGRPAAGRPAPRDLRAIFSAIFFSKMPLPPRCRAARSRPPSSEAAGVYSCKFPNRKYIFVKNENKKYKNKKTAYSSASCWSWSEPGIFFFGSLERFLFFVFVGHKKKRFQLRDTIFGSKK